VAKAGEHVAKEPLDCYPKAIVSASEKGVSAREGV
jgi:hypothetical protein